MFLLMLDIELLNAICELASSLKFVLVIAPFPLLLFPLMPLLFKFDFEVMSCM
jgi:hypothetical protein